MSMLTTITASASQDDPLLVRPGCFLSHPQTELAAPYPRRLLFSRLSRGMYVLFRVTEGAFSLTTPFANAYVTKIKLAPKEKLFCNLEHVIAFSERAFPSRVWKIDTTSVLMGKLSYTYFRGPGMLYVCGVGGLTVEHVAGTAEYDSRKVIGWSHTLKVGVTSKHSPVAAMLQKNEVCIDQFEGKGKVLVQPTGTSLSAVARTSSGGGSITWFDILSFLIGIPLPRP